MKKSPMFSNNNIHLFQMPVGKLIWNAQSSTVHVTGFERLKRIYICKDRLHHPYLIHDTSIIK